MPVTARQRHVFEFISRFQETHKQPPTIAEIGKQFKMSSSASVHSILSALEREGLIKRIPNVSRGIEIVEQDAALQQFEPRPEAVGPGRVQAEEPAEVEQAFVLQARNSRQGNETCYWRVLPIRRHHRFVFSRSLYLQTWFRKLSLPD